MEQSKALLSPKIDILLENRGYSLLVNYIYSNIFIKSVRKLCSCLQPKLFVLFEQICVILLLICHIEIMLTYGGNNII